MLLSVLFMFFCATLLIPFIAFAMYLLIKGDAERVRDAASRVAAQLEADGAAIGAPQLVEVTASPVHGSTEHLQRPLQTA